LYSDERGTDEIVFVLFKVLMRIPKGLEVLKNNQTSMEVITGSPKTTP